MEIPSHIGIIMDGNGRWAKKRGLPRMAGHIAGVESLKKVTRHCSNIGVKILTVYAFSTENWKRPLEEVKSLMCILNLYLDNFKKELHKKNVKIGVIGDIGKLSAEINEKIERVIDYTKYNDGLILNLALNYGGRDEILRATLKIHEDIKNNLIKAENLDEELFSKYLDTKSLPCPDIIIRPSGELRLSNFMLWQAAYSEFWFSNILWPDFNEKHIDKAIEDYNRRDRRYGGI